MSGYIKGIDVSEHNGVIDWEKVKASGIGFAMIRGGYGQTLDKQFKRNASECNRLGIPCGIYWFSYALNAVGAAREATACLDAIRPYKIDYPVAFDLEYDSVNYAQKKGVYIGTGLASDMARAFLHAIRAAGYSAMNYTNQDYLNRYFDAQVKAEFPVWLAQWPNGTPSLDKPPRMCAIWQYSEKGSVPGTKGPVDLDVCYETYPKGEKELKNVSKEELRTLIRETVREILDEENPVYKDLKDVPEYWKPAASALLAAGAVNGGTPEAVCATDLNLRRETLKAVVVAAMYHDAREGKR